MRKGFVVLILTLCLFITGCGFVTSGEGSWEIYGGFRTKQYSTEPANISIQSDVLDKIVDSFTDGEVSEAE